MAKTIVTHLSPDLDAVCAVWLIRRYMPGFADAALAFVPAESTLDGVKADDDPDIIHVDTGGGKFDHHDGTKRTSAAELVFEFLKNRDAIRKKDAQAIQEVVSYVTEIDNFQEVHYPDAASVKYDFLPHQLIFASRTIVSSDHEIVELFSNILTMMYSVSKTRIAAEKDIADGFIFETLWGKTIAMHSKNEEAVKLALKKNFMAALRKDPVRKFLKIKINPDLPQTLEPLFARLQARDPQAHWSLQGRGHIIINGSSRIPNSVATKLELDEVIAIMRSME